ncbi:DUF349 domain-containing protein [Pseudoalteromonas fenneropenaei]|uniref:DUF349 domain-containing protein n=1 Tax=Pseudoalteromonas fenneropenaei TaxID=1737459 RepID=A0ABV7CF02_9GAMM
MIFKHLFTPKWKHPKLHIRESALDKLDVQKDQHILTTMALEDSSAQIRRQALSKLNDLGLWWQASKKDQELKEHALAQISNAVLNANDALSHDIRDEYIDKLAPAKVLEKLAFNDRDTGLRVKLLKRLADASLIEKAFREGDERLQRALLELVGQYQLQKALLKHAQGEVKAELEAFLEQQHLAAVMPEQVTQAAKLILAKLNYLREKQDYLQVKSEAEALRSQWTDLELHWLTEALQQENLAKFDTLNAKLSTHLARLEVQYEQVQQQEQQREQQAAAVQLAEQTVAECEALCADIEQLLSGNFLVEVQAQISQAVTQLSAHQYASLPELQQALQVLAQLQQKLESLPKLASAINQFETAFVTLQNCAVPNDITELDSAEQTHQQAHAAAKAQLHHIDVAFRKPLQAKLRAEVTAFAEKIAPLVTVQKATQQQARKKALDTKRLIEQGRFNVAFGVFKGFIAEYQQLTAAYQAPLSALHDELQAKLAEIQDWQKYATAPKRAEILAEVAELVAEVAPQAKQRAAQVKALRQRWNECGKATTAEEVAQSEAFETALEQAFEPCRAYFAELEQQKAQAIVARQEIIQQMQALSDTAATVSDWKAYEGQFQQLKLQWRDAPKLDNDSYQKLSAEFKTAQDAAWLQLKGSYDNNAAKKAEILALAQAQLSNENLDEACEQLKALQQTWQGIGFAGAKQEHKLWQSFRAVNDEVFGKRQAAFNERKQAQSAEAEQQTQQLDAIAQECEQVATLAQCQQLLKQLRDFNPIKPLRAKQQAMMNALNDKVAELQQAKQQQAYDELLESLRTEQLAERWKARPERELSANDWLLRLEILTTSPSPQTLQSERMNMQVAMLEEKLSGAELQVEACIRGYVNTAELPISEEQYLRFKACLEM